MKNYNFVIYIAIVVILILETIYVYAQAELASVGPVLADLETEIKEIKRKNILLKSEILKRESLIYTAERAEEMGFIPATYIYIK